MKNQHIQVASVLIFLSILTTPASSSDKLQFLTPKELAELGDKSKVAFATKLVTNRAGLPSIQHPGWPTDSRSEPLAYPAIAVGPNGSRALISFQCSAGAMKALEAAEPLFQKQAYDSAHAIYQGALAEDSACYLLALNAGDCDFLSGNPARALQSYDQALKLNPADYRGHWFRASALLALGRKEEARSAYSQALAMSAKNAKLLAVIKSHAAELGIEVRDTWFQPEATARSEGQGVTIYTVDKPHWWVYGLCKGLWLGEDSHRLQMTGEAKHHWTSTEELECFGALLGKYETAREAGDTSPEAQLDTLHHILDAKLLDAFVLYEFGSRVSPEFTLLLPEQTQKRIAEYVRSYVLPSVVAGRSNNGVNLSVRPVTPLANRASAAPVRPAGYAGR